MAITEKALILQVNRKLQKVLSGKSWTPQLNLIPQDDEALHAMNSLLDYIEMLQSQVKGLEDQIRTLR